MSRSTRSLVVGFALVAAALVAVDLPAQVQPADPCEEGHRLFVQKDFLGAEPLLKRCLDSDPDNAQAWLSLTVIDVLQGKIEPALSYGKEAVARDPENPDTHYWYGRALIQSGQPEKAQEHWEKGLTLSQRHVGILEGLARLSMDQGLDAKAYNLLNQLQMQGVDDAWIHKLLADLARRKGLWNQAMLHWQDAIDRMGETGSNLTVLGELAILAGRKDEAVSIFQRAVAVEPTAATWGGLGEAWFAVDEVDSAEAALREAVALDPQDPRHHYNLANVLEIQGEFDEAEQQFETYVARAPQDPIGHLNYGIHLERRGQLEQALAEVARAAELDPELVSALVVQAQILEKLGRYDEALLVIGRLETQDAESLAELEAWRQRMASQMDSDTVARGAGKVRLLHIVTSDREAADKALAELQGGADFATLAVRYSAGPTAHQGGDIGWVDPTQMVEPLRSAITALAVGTTSPLVEARGQYHIFKRIR